MSGSEGDDLAVASEVLRREAQAILDLLPQIDGTFSQAVDLLAACEGKVIVTAVGKSGHVASKIAATMASTGTPAFFVHPTEALHGDLGMIRARDVVLAMSHSGATAELLAILPVIQKIGAKVIAICAGRTTPLGRAAQVCIATGAIEEADTLNLAPTASTTVFLALGDALAVALLRRRGFRPEDFALFHPGGKLGKALLRVRDIMSKTKNPTVPAAASVQEAIVISKEANLGGVSVVDAEGRLAGFVSDGDIGRILQRHRGEALLAVMEGPVTAVMNPRPLGIDADTPGEKAVAVMEERPTYVLPVLERDGRVIGMVRMHDLIRAGFTCRVDGE
ncbi:MAG: KpsF/GutQ family sugar-phosphate isomerase [Candidatus Sumerlaeia bacterium]|nr:KpsF/GutQ family sugar-phosphate isomerase [Candidatus Sumerlaeia bacterium]